MVRLRLIRVLLTRSSISFILSGRKMLLPPLCGHGVPDSVSLLGNQKVEELCTDEKYEVVRIDAERHLVATAVSYIAYTAIRKFTKKVWNRRVAIGVGCESTGHVKDRERSS